MHATNFSDLPSAQILSSKDLNWSWRGLCCHWETEEETIFIITSHLAKEKKKRTFVINAWNEYKYIHSEGRATS